MKEKKWRHRETGLNIKSDKDKGIQSAIEKVLEVREDLERYIFHNPQFRTTLEPIQPKGKNDPEIIYLMKKASEIAKTGPFAAVAGSISELATRAGLDAGAGSMLVDNGGDIAMAGDRDFKVGVWAGESSISGRLVFSVDSKNLPRGICTSSGTVGHSLSFGDAEAVVVNAKKPSIADAAATAVANIVEGKDIENSIKKGLNRADDIKEINGCLIIREESVGQVGKLPEINTMGKKQKVKPEKLVKTPSNFFE